MPRYIRCIVFLMILAGCRKPTERVGVRVVDLIAELDRAEKRPPVVLQVTDQRIGDESHPSIIAPVPSRLIWSLPLPQRGVFHAFVALAEPPSDAAVASIRLRIGVSDHRVYEGLSDVTLPPGERRWTDLRADLSDYAGWKWSLFYRPDRVTWRVVLAADAIGSAEARAIWGSPEIITDTRSAREYAQRHRRR